MGLHPQVGRYIIREHTYKNITGQILTIGRQTIHISPNQLKLFLEEEGLPLPPPEQIKLDTTTTNADMGPFVDDKSFFGSFSSARLRSLDHSDFEGADLIWDLNQPLPHELENRFDFIYNGSVLDNVWDPAACLRNMTRLLKPGGRIVHVEHGTRVNGPYLTFPPDWFHDYYCINKFVDCKTYVATIPVLEQWNQRLEWKNWEPFVVEGGKVHPTGLFISPPRDFFTICIAEKGLDSTYYKTPIQYQYRSPEQQKQNLLQALKYKLSPRPVISFS